MDSFSQAPTTDTASISTLATSFLPSSLVKSIDGDSVRSPNMGSTPYLNNGNSYSRQTSNWSLPTGNSDSRYLEQGNGMASQQFSPPLSHHSADYPATSLPTTSSPRSVNGMSPVSGHRIRFSGGGLGHNRSFGSSQSSFEHFLANSTPLETVDENRDAKYRKWFPSFINSQAGQLAVFPNSTTNDSSVTFGRPKNKSGLNPDAKSFCLSRGRSFLLNGSNSTSTSTEELSTSPPSDSDPMTSASLHASPPSLASRMYGSLTQTLHRHQNSQDRLQNEIEPEEPTPSTPTGNFFSSLLAFAPSPAERQALQRGIETASSAAASVNGNGVGHRGDSVGDLGAFKGGNGDSQEFLPVPSTPWSVAEFSTSSSDNLPVVTPTKRSLSSLWSRNKPSVATASTAKNMIIEVADILPGNCNIDEGEKQDDAAATKEEGAPPPGPGGRFAKFGRQNQKTSTEGLQIREEE